MCGKTRIEEQFERIHQACGTSSLKELSELLQTGMPELTNALRRGKIPESLFISLQHIKNINPEWVLSGCGPRHLLPAPANNIRNYADGQTAREQREKLEALKNFSSRELAEELLRRLTGQNA